MDIKYIAEPFYRGRCSGDFTPLAGSEVDQGIYSNSLPSFTIATKEGWNTSMVPGDTRPVPEIVSGQKYALFPDPSDNWIDVTISSFTIDVIECVLTDVLRTRLYDRGVTVKLDKPQLIYQTNATQRGPYQPNMIELRAPLGLPTIVVARPVYFIEAGWSYPTLQPREQYAICPAREGVAEIRVVCQEINSDWLEYIASFIALTTPGVPDNAQVVINYT